MADRRRKRRSNKSGSTSKKTAKVEFADQDLNPPIIPIESIELDEPRIREESIGVEQPAIFSVYLHFIGVSNDPDKIEAISREVIQAAQQRGLLHQDGFQVEMNTALLIPRPNSVLDQSLYSEE